jgi:hypothetical protein
MPLNKKTATSEPLTGSPPATTTSSSVALNTDDSEDQEFSDPPFSKNYELQMV